MLKGPPNRPAPSAIVMLARMSSSIAARGGGFERRANVRVDHFVHRAPDHGKPGRLAGHDEPGGEARGTLFLERIEQRVGTFQARRMVGWRGLGNGDHARRQGGDHALHKLGLDAGDRAEMVQHGGRCHARLGGDLGQFEFQRTAGRQNGLGGGQNVRAGGLRRAPQAGRGTFGRRTSFLIDIFIGRHLSVTPFSEERKP